MNKRCSSTIVGRALACINMRETCKKNAGLVLVFRGFVKDFSDCFRNFVFISRI